MLTFSHGYALLVGVGQTAYQPWSLPVTVRDAQALHKVLVDPDRCGYPQDDRHVRLLHDAGATRQALCDGLAWLAERAEADADATAVVFFSGHGWVARDGFYYLIPHDTDPSDVAGSALAGRALTEALRAIRARRLLVVLDCCHAGGMATAKAGPPLSLPDGMVEFAPPKGLVDDLSQGAGRAVFSSSLGSQPSWVRPDGLLSLYTFHLIEALEGKASRPGDAYVRLSGLMAHLGTEVPLSAARLGREQTPFFDTAAEDFPIALLRGGKGALAVGAAPPDGAASVARLQDRLEELRAECAHLIARRGAFGPSDLPFEIPHRIRKARESIRQIKRELAGYGVAVEDRPSIDEELPYT